MSKLEVGAATPSRQWHVLEEIVGSALHRTHGELAAHEVAVRLPGNLPLVFVDGLLLEQVFVNLLENAAHYTPPGTQVTIRAAVDGRSVRISVSDNGPGLPPGSEERIFDKFYRAAPSADGVSRAIVKAHGGHITASNRPGGGAEFLIRLPLQKETPQVVVE
jgi:two-component system sensor histidine kinase KdpD